MIASIFSQKKDGYEDGFVISNNSFLCVEKVPNDN